MRRTDEQGAVVPLVAVALTVLIAVTALTVDIGRQRVARTDMQSVADLVALDLARELDGRSATAIAPTLQAAADRSLARNATASGDGITVTPQLGTLSSTGVFSTVGGTAKPDAVRVTARATVEFAFEPGTGGASRSAVASSHPQACYKLGSWGARLDTNANANVLYQVLSAHGVGASVGAATYQSLAGAHVDLTSLAAALDLGSPEALGTTSVSLATLLNAVAQVVGTNGSSSAQVSALDTFRAGLGSLAAAPVSLGNLVSIATGAGSGLSGAVNLADLVVGAVLVADGNSAVAVPNLLVDVPGVTSVSSSLTLVQAAKTACGFAGSTPSSNNQASLSVRASLPSQPVSVSGITNLQVGSSTPLTLTASAGTATSSLDTVTCNRAVKSASVSTTGALLSAQLTLPLSADVTIGSGVTAIHVTVGLTYRSTLSSSGPPATVTITVPPDAYDSWKSNGGSAAELPTATVDPVSTPVGLTGSLLSSIVSAVASQVVTPLVASLNANVVGPLSELAGLSTAGADVLLLDHPTCSTPALRG